MHADEGARNYKLPTDVNIDRVRAGIKNPNLETLSELGFEMDISYQNGFPYPVHVVLRSGLAFKLPAATGRGRVETGFTVQVRYRVPRHVNIDVHRLLDDVDAKTDPHLAATKEAFSRAHVMNTTRGTECVLVYALTRATFEANRSSVYINELDLTVSRASEEMLTVHPNSVHGEQLRLAEEQRVAGFLYNIRINDPRHLFGERYINIGGHVYFINIVSDRSKPEGVYVRSPSQDDPMVVEERCVGFETADKELMLFRNAFDAQTLGNMAETRKREYEERQHELKMEWQEKEFGHRERIQELERQQLDFREAKAEREAELAAEIQRLKSEALQREYADKQREADWIREKSEMERKSQREKDEFDRRSARRKDFSEFLKWAPAVAVSIAVLYAKYIEAKKKE